MKIPLIGTVGKTYRETFRDAAVIAVFAAIFYGIAVAVAFGGAKWLVPFLSEFLPKVFEELNLSAEQSQFGVADLLDVDLIFKFPLQMALLLMGTLLVHGLAIVVGAFVTSALHRRQLLSRSENNFFSCLIPGRRHLRVAWALTKVAVLYVVCNLVYVTVMDMFPTYGGGNVVVGIALGTIELVVHLAGFLFVVYVVFRCSLVLPAVALDQPMTLRESWRKMSGTSLPLFGSLVLSYILYFGLAGLLVGSIIFLLGSEATGPNSLYAAIALFLVVAAVLLVFGYGLMISILSVAYGTVTGEPVPSRSAETE